MVPNSTGGSMKCQYALIFLTLFACSKSPDKTLKINGHFSAYNSVRIKPQVEGTLLSIEFQDGHMVEKGETLFIIDPKPFEINLELAIANRALNISKLQYAAEKTFRYKTLLENKYVSEIDFIHYTSELTTYEALVMKSEAEIRKAKLELENCIICSPIAGRVALHQLDLGNSLQKNDTLLVVDQIDPIYIELTLTEKQYHSLKSPIEVTLLETGETVSVSFIRATENGVFLRATVPNPLHKLAPGESSTVSLRL